MENNRKEVLELIRKFEVPREQLYRAWTDPVELKQWWMPEGLQLQQVQTEIQNNGNILYLFTNKENQEIRVTGQYKEVIPGEKLVYTWNWELPIDNVEDSNFTLSITFHEEGSKSGLMVKQEFLSSEEGVNTHRQAWEKSLASLQSFLLHQKNTGEQPASGNGNAENTGAPGVKNEKEVTGYNEIEEQQKVGGYS